MEKPIKPEIKIPAAFALEGQKTDFVEEKIQKGFSNVDPDVLAGDNLNKFIDDTYQGLNYAIAGTDALNLIQEGGTLTVENGNFVSKTIALDRFLNKSQITNCVLEIPQRVNLVDNGTNIIIKAGTIGIQPNGFEADGTTPKFDYITVTSDITLANNQTTTLMLGLNGAQNVYRTPIDRCFSGPTAPASPVNLTIWYDTSTNLVKRYLSSSSSWEVANYTLPLGILNYTASGTPGSIQQVFNGFGYIGSSLWIDKGVRMLIPNYRNEDGTLTGNPEISIFDNQTGIGPFLTTPTFEGAPTTLTRTFKATIDEPRPDGSDNRSFPSGHATIAFAGATVLHKEFGRVSPWISVAGYSVATFTAVDRVLADRHHWYDVAAGAAIGVLSTELCYYVSGKIFKDKGVSVAFNGSGFDVAINIR